VNMNAQEQVDALLKQAAEYGSNQYDGMRALSEEELKARLIRQAADMRPMEPTNAYYAALANSYPQPKIPVVSQFQM